VAWINLDLDKVLLEKYLGVGTTTVPFYNYEPTKEFTTANLPYHYKETCTAYQLLLEHQDSSNTCIMKQMLLLKGARLRKASYIS
jgi:hypothetical protein